MCTACAVGTYKEAPGNTACDACPFEGNVFSTTTGTGTTDKDTGCVCNTGTTPAPGAVDAGYPFACNVCAAGKYKDVLGTADCASCPEGYWTEPRADPLPTERFQGADDISLCVCPPRTKVSGDGRVKALTGEDGWRLVRYLPEGAAKWHPINDNLAGLLPYDDESPISGQTHTAGAWSIVFGTFDEYFISNAAMSSWL